MKIFYIVLIVLVGVFIFAPRVSTSKKFTPYPVPDDITELERYLEQEESNYDLKEGLEKQIHWHGDVEKTEYAFVYLHGFTASIMEIEPFTTNLADHYQSNAYFTRFKGNGTNNPLESTKGVKASDWIADLDEAYQIGKLIGDKVIFVSTSTGGTLSAIGAEKYPDVYAHIMISPNFYPQDPAAPFILFPFGPMFVKMIQGPTYGNPHNENTPADQKIAYSGQVSSEFLFPMMGSVKIASKIKYENIDDPALMFIHMDDKVVKASKTKGDVYPRWGKHFLKKNERVSPEVFKKLYVADKSGNADNHVIVGDLLSPVNNDEFLNVTIDFIDSLESNMLTN